MVFASPAYNAAFAAQITFLPLMVDRRFDQQAADGLSADELVDSPTSVRAFAVN